MGEGGYGKGPHRGGREDPQCKVPTLTSNDVSHLHSSSTPGVFYTYFYNHAHRLRLEKLLYLELSRSPNGFFKYFWIQVAVSEVKRPLRNRFGSETVKNITAICNGHSPTDTSFRSGVTVM
jgi:hypothetical protein